MLCLVTYCDQQKACMDINNVGINYLKNKTLNYFHIIGNKHNMMATVSLLAM